MFSAPPFAAAPLACSLRAMRAAWRCCFFAFRQSCQQHWQLEPLFEAAASQGPHAAHGLRRTRDAPEGSKGQQTVNDAWEFAGGARTPEDQQRQQNQAPAAKMAGLGGSRKGELY